jgi:hypothetical protein
MEREWLVAPVSTIAVGRGICNGEEPSQAGLVGATVSLIVVKLLCWGVANWSNEGHPPFQSDTGAQ